MSRESRGRNRGGTRAVHLAKRRIAKRLYKDPSTRRRERGRSVGKLESLHCQHDRVFSLSSILRRGWIVRSRDRGVEGEFATMTNMLVAE